MRYQIITCLIGVVIIGSVRAQSPDRKSIWVYNNSDIDRNELISIPLNRLIDDYDNVSVPDLTFKSAADGSTIIHQLETGGLEKPQNALLLVAVAANDSTEIIMDFGPTYDLPQMVFARYVPERFDDFAWENDKIAYRLYGRALEGKPGDAEGMDVWCKRTENLIIDKWYGHGDYHRDHGEGLDYYSVGNTLGAGDVAPYFEDSLYYPRHYDRYKVLDNGPLRTSFILYYEPWAVGEAMVSVSKTITLDVGKQLNKIDLLFDIQGKDSLQIAAGVARRKEPTGVYKNPTKGVFAYEEPVMGNNGQLFLGVIIPNGYIKVEEKAEQYLTLFDVLSNTSITYYTGAAWNKAGDITDYMEWLQYLDNEKKQLDKPLNFKVKKNYVDN